MEYLYSLNTKLIEGKTYYFVKKIMTFSEFKGLANVVIGYGMHTNYEKACNIAGIDEIAWRKQLLHELEQRNLPLTQAFKPQKSVERRSVQIADTVNRWLAERGAEVLN